MSEDPEKEIQVTDVSSNKSANPSPSSKPRPNSLQSLKNHLTVEVATAHADILLLTCCIISGLVDSTIYHAYGTFVSMQTVLPSLQTLPPSILLHCDHSCSYRLQGQYNFPWPWWFHPTRHLQALRLGQILPLHHLLLSRLLRLQLLLSSPHATPPLNARRLLPHPITLHFSDRRHYSSGSCQRKPGHHP